MDTRRFTKGDLLRIPRATLQDADGVAVNLTTQTVKFRMVNAQTGAVKINDVAATIDSASLGQVSYMWVASDVNTAGVYFAWFIRVDGLNTEHFPPGRQFQIVIEDVT